VKRFSFNLEKILGLRSHAEQERAAELAAAQGRVAEIEGRIRATAREKTRAAGEQFAPAHSAADILVYERYVNRLDGEAERLEAAAALAELQAGEARDRYIEASREKKILEKLKEKKAEEYRAARAAGEVQAADDAGGHSREPGGK